jgi:methanogenic corrinoid protein MtbC1
MGYDLDMPERRADGAVRLSIGALARATGIPVETLRTWESRYGFPMPERKPSGHRLYPASSVARLRRIAEALARGHRAGQVVAVSEKDLSRLIDLTPDAAPPAGPAPTIAGGEGADLLGLVERFDAERLTRVLLGDWARLSPFEFLEARVVPLLRAVGSAWEAGRLEIRHEHFASERIGDLLRTLRLPFEERARGPLVVMATLPGESHGLGLQMAALVLARAGCRLLYLGTEVPPAEMLQLTRDLPARALALSVSLASQGPGMAKHLRSLRDKLPRRATLLVGGDGAPRALPRAEVFHDFRGLDGWARQAPGSASAR